ncbi:Dolichol kinase [Mycena chlorophos]|uniref:dolichol kinase n=1 Tax=Mycena chlorophos TaxID=658473 RepID=A0A8H6TGD6_MYCCL|nr:Dolichol kinase [Mycena chlorophos]
MDSRRIGESLVLMCSLFSATAQIEQFDTWMAYELYLLLASALAYLAYTYGTVMHRTSPKPTPVLQQPKRKPDDKFGLIWMSVPKNYRDSGDDGILTGLLLGPLIAAALLLCSLEPHPGDGLPPDWAIEAPIQLPTRNARAPPPLVALLRGRYNLLSLATFTSAILLLHVSASQWLENRKSAAAMTTSPTDGERRSVPRSEGVRGLYFIFFTLGSAGSLFVLRIVLEVLRIGIWQHLNLFDVIVGAIFYQFTLYVALRMAHRGLTLGELGLICFGGTAVFMEFLNITTARIWPVTTAFLKTYRLPTPLVVFQTALVAGPFLTGFLIAPLLVLSRHAAQTPMRRQRRLLPSEALRARQRLAAAAAVVALLIIFGPLGLWTRWCLGNRDPWIWAVLWVVSRHRRVALLAYWAALGSVSVAGWTRQLARTRRTLPNPAPVDATASPTSALFAASNELLDRAPTLKLNERRKFFHALVVLMFIPGIAFDPAFTHLAFSAAFAAFVFAEYIRYFAIYPLGAAVHRFMSEFLDTKDSGTAILSHFYLLTGCAGALWLEGPSWLLQYTGVLVLGIGDALASIVGKRHGRHVWSPSTTKTLEGSAAFSASVVASAWLLRLFGLAEQFSTLRYVFVIALASVLEALSDQNDNLTLPLFTWSVLVVARVT